MMCPVPPIRPPHVPVLLGPLLAAVAPVSRTWVDGTFGAGGYALGLLDAGAERVIGIDRDPSAIAMAAPLAADVRKLIPRRLRRKAQVIGPVRA